MDIKITKKMLFEELADNWEKETINLSSVHKIIENNNYQKIIKMGPDVVPIILNKMKTEPNFWFWALQAITGENPVTEDMWGQVNLMTEAWLEWGKEHELC